MTPDAQANTVRLVWEGNTGEGTARYTGYSRRYRALVEGKPDLVGTADPAFRGEADKLNPEDLFLASISACHMLFYLSLCARQGVRVVAYEDHVRGRLTIRPDGGGSFEEVVLSPRVTIESAETRPLALDLHDAAHELCFIANSCRVTIRHEPTVSVAVASRSAAQTPGTPVEEGPP